MSNQENPSCQNCNKIYHRDDFKYGSSGGNLFVCDACKDKRWAEEKKRAEMVKKQEEKSAEISKSMTDMNAERMPSLHCEFCRKTFALSEEDFTEHQEVCKENV